MHICFDFSAGLQQAAGIARYQREMLPRLRTALAPDRVSIFTNNAHRVEVPAELSGGVRYGVRLGNKAWRLLVAGGYVLRHDLDAHFPGVDLFFAADHLLPRFRAIRSIINIRDLSYLLYPQFHSRYNRVFLRLLMPSFARQATHIIVPSEATCRDLATRYHLPLERITVVPEGVDERFRAPVGEDECRRVRQDYGLRNPYILYVGTLEPRKNIAALLDAFAALLQTSDLPALDLVLAGNPGWLYAPILERIETLGLEERVRRIGFVRDADLPALYSAAELFAFPSWYEGFGLPPLEAMACGTPVVASKAASLPEVVGDAGLLVAPDDTHQLAAALRSILEQPALRRRLQEAGQIQAARFTWERTARTTASLCREVAQRRAEPLAGNTRR